MPELEKEDVVGMVAEHATRTGFDTQYAINTHVFSRGEPLQLRTDGGVPNASSPVVNSPGNKG